MQFLRTYSKSPGSEFLHTREGTGDEDFNNFLVILTDPQPERPDLACGDAPDTHSMDLTPEMSNTLSVN